VYADPGWGVGRSRYAGEKDERMTELRMVGDSSLKGSASTDERTVVTVQLLESDAEVQAYLTRGNEQMDLLGYTEHGQRHARLVGNIAQNVLLRLGFPQRRTELAEIAGYLHDIGNVIYRDEHDWAGALIARDVLLRLGADFEEIALVMGAIGNHEEERGEPVSDVSAAVILADKSDVHRSRVQNRDMLAFDIHDRVNYAVERSFLRVDGEQKTITLELDIDTGVSQVGEYFEIFMSRMLLSRRAALFLDCRFDLTINGNSVF
jgi:metal-dependent HD superfamily phosphatase/phosphodiesterase